MSDRSRQRPTTDGIGLERDRRDAQAVKVMHGVDGVTAVATAFRNMFGDNVN